MAPDSGLAGPAILLAAAAIGVALGALAGGLAAWRLPDAVVRPLFPVALVAAVLAGGLLAAQVQRGRRARTAREAVGTAAVMAPFTAGAVSHRADDGSTFMDIDVDGAGDTFTMTVRGRPGHPRCEGRVPAARHAAILEVVRTADGRLARYASPCTPLVGDVTRTLRWSLPRAGRPPREVQLTTACAGVYSEFDGLYAALDSLAFSAAATEGALTCEPASGRE